MRRDEDDDRVVPVGGEGRGKGRVLEREKERRAASVAGERSQALGARRSAERKEGRAGERREEAAAVHCRLVFQPPRRDGQVFRGEGKARPPGRDATFATSLWR